MKPHDIIVALKISQADAKTNVRQIAEQLNISKSEVSNSLARLKKSSLLNHSTREVLKSNLLEFIVFGVRYCFPGELGAPARGLVTAWGHPLFSQIRSSELPVWPSLEGSTYGPSLKPLYPKLVEVCRKDEFIYECAACIDSLRIGRSREKQIAREYFTSLLKAKK